MSESNSFLKSAPQHGDDANIEARGRVYVGKWCDVCSRAVPVTGFDWHTH